MTLRGMSKFDTEEMLRTWMEKMQNRCLDLVGQWKNMRFSREVGSVYSTCLFHIFPPLFHTYLSLQYWYTPLSPLCHINSHLPASKFRSWTCVFMRRKKTHHDIANLFSSSKSSHMEYLACINVCTLEGWEFLQDIQLHEFMTSTSFMFHFFLWKSVF